MDYWVKAIIALVLLASTAFSQGTPPITVTEVDGSPRITGVTRIIVSNGTLTKSGTTATITTGGGGGTPGGSSGELQWNSAGSFAGITGSVTDGTNVTFPGNLQVVSANGRIWGISGLAAGHTVNFQYGGDSANSIVTTFGDKTIFRSFHGTDFFKGGEGITILSVGASGSASWFNGNLSVGSTTTNAAELYVVADSAGEPVIRADTANNPTQPVFQARNITTTVWEAWAAPWMVQAEATTNPTSTQLADGNHFSIYRKGDIFVIAYNAGGTITYLTIPLDGTTTTWTQTTSAP